MTTTQHETTRQREERTERCQAPGKQLPTGVDLASGCGQRQWVRYRSLNTQNGHWSGR